MSEWHPPLWYARLAGIAWRAVIVAVAAALLVTGIIGLSSVILPLALGMLFACGLNPIVVRLRRRGVAPALAAGLAVLLLALIVGSVAWLTVRAVVDQWDEITTFVDAGRAALVDAATDTGVEDATAADIDDDVSGYVSSTVRTLLTGLVRIAPTVAGAVTTLLLSILVAFFFLKDGALMWRWIVSRVGEASELTDRIGQRVWTTLSGFIAGQAAIAAADASMIALGAIVLGVPAPGAILMLTFIGAFIPFIGAFLSGLLAVMLALGDGGLWHGVAMLTVVLVVQVVEGNILQPWIQGRAVKLHPLVIALSVAAGGAIAGFLGVFLAVPVTAAGFVALSELRRAGILGPAEIDAVIEGEVRPAHEPPAP